eukprot:CAMPEP_0180175630 /NCGR_PEP_ID=MMETSP0986-20121125/36823_1 /TAXON_ID=697907 /ORGANISM="non described non described, Strain CCMP2293" /LENGTH=73 /DNA_ID=CAMNT_0022128121 /DNA_START=15 /DNA_END=233 /DNA_ORIENTATION=-
MSSSSATRAPSAALSLALYCCTPTAVSFATVARGSSTTVSSSAIFARCVSPTAFSCATVARCFSTTTFSSAAF